MHDYSKVYWGKPHPLPEVRKVKVIELTEKQREYFKIGDLVGPFIVGSLPNGDLCFIKNNLKLYH